MKVRSTVIYLFIVLISTPLAMADSRQDPPEMWQAYAQKLEAGAWMPMPMRLNFTKFL